MSFFKAYDMRGVFGKDFTLDTVRAVGEALPKVLGAKRFLIGRDARASSPSVRDALVAGLQASGATVTDLGLATTPMVYFFTAREDFDASVQITASHNPPDNNGMKVSKKTALPVGYDAGLDRVEAYVNARLASGAMPPVVAREPEPMFHAPGVPQTDPHRLDSYLAWLNCHAGDISGLRYAVDCSDGMAGILARRLFGEGPIYLNEKPDGRFPHHSPNPLAAEARAQISRTVVENKLDLGVIFDGDADRVMFVDEHGAFVQPDYLIPVIAKAYLEREPGATVIHDVRTSRGAIEALKAMGAKTVMGKVGHAFAKVALRKLHAVCGGELAGHYYFRDFYGCDSGELAALKVLDAVARAKHAGLSFSALMKPISGKYANSGELNFTVEDKDAAIARVLAAAAKLAPETGRETMDGYRLEYAEGWVSVRKSNTEPLLRLIVETDTKERLAAWTATLSAAIQTVRHQP